MKCLFKGPPPCTKDARSRSNYCDDHQGLPGTVLKFAGNLSFNELRNALVLSEDSSTYELIDLKVEGDHNLAYLRERSKPLTRSYLLLVQVESGASIDTLRAQYVASGKQFLFSTSILVNEEETEILGFRDLT